jgi:hypothetical protein
MGDPATAEDDAMTYPIPPRDDRVHVFSVSDGPLKLEHQTYLSRLIEPGDGPSLEEAMGAPIDATYAEVFAVSDVASMGLRAYLAQAHDIPEPTLAADAARLDALSGDVVVLAPRAVEGVEALSPLPEITPIGAYASAEADAAPRPLPRAEARPEPRPATPGVAADHGPGSRRIVYIVLLALAAAILLMLLLT